MRRRSKGDRRQIVCPKCGGRATETWSDSTKARCQNCSYEFSIYLRKE